MIRRELPEWGRIAYGTSEKEIPAHLADRLVAIARRSPLGGADGADILSAGRTMLQAKQVVGVLVADGCALEILPKIGDLGTGAVRRELVRMLAVALDVDVADGSLTELDWQHHDLLEILVRLFARKLADAAREGLPRRYVGVEHDLPVLRGRLDLKRQFTVLAASPQALACRYDTLSANIPLNHVMKAAVKRLARVARSAESQRLLRELAFDFAEVADLPPGALRFDEIVLDRTNARWRDLVALARLLLGDRFQTTSAGAGQGFSLLFPMNDLFEEFVARMLDRAVRPSGLKVERQRGFRYCVEDTETGARRFQTRPDILVRRGADIVLVIDTKWKRLAARVDDPKHGVSQADVYQLMAYSQVYGCPRLILLYPHHTALGSQEGVLARYVIVGSGNKLEVASIDVSRDPNLVGACLRRLVESALAAGAGQSEAPTPADRLDRVSA